jgi:hypothetical protein
MKSSLRLNCLKLAVIAAMPVMCLAAFGSRAAQADGHRGPPPEAYTACESKAVGDDCTVSLHDVTVDGKCDVFGSDTRLSCRPNHPPPIPQAAFDACRDKKEADACTVTFDGHTIEGTCEQGPGDGLSCRPSGPPPGAPR